MAYDPVKNRQSDSKAEAANLEISTCNSLEGGQASNRQGTDICQQMPQLHPWNQMALSKPAMNTAGDYQPGKDG